MFLFYLLQMLNVVSERSSDQAFDIYFRTAFPVSSVKQLLISIGKLQDPAAAR